MYTVNRFILILPMPVQCADIYVVYNASSAHELRDATVQIRNIIFDFQEMNFTGMYMSVTSR